MRWKTPPPPAAPESVTEILHQIGRALSEAGSALERLADAAPTFVPPPQPPMPERPPEPAPKPRAGYINTKDAAEYMGFRPNTLRVWRMKGKGPKGWLRVCGRVYYPVQALDQFFRDAASNSKVPHGN